MTSYSNSFRLGRMFGIDVFIDATILLPVALVAFSGAEQGTDGIIIGITFATIIFLSVLLHEFGHALAARRCGIGTERITLGMLGGVAQLGGRIAQPGRPVRDRLSVGEDLFITAAGPAVNLVIWGLGLTALSSLDALDSAGRFWIRATAQMNLQLLWFNLIPAFPMDGGRILNALLQLKFPLLSAFRITNQVARVAAAGMAVWAVFIYMESNHVPFMLLFIAWMVFSNANQTLRYLRAAEMQVGQGRTDGR
ncbi:MAG: site-2 protease family protein [Verrucomicrobiales bacterium]|nr:site-2 protease family protein [Verrucomicrobiales bacterium]